PDRSAIVTSDPYRPRTVNVVVSGVAPRAPGPAAAARPNTIRVRVQERDPAISTDLGWRDVSPPKATVTARRDGTVGAQPDLGIWAGTVSFAADPEPSDFRLLIEEHEFIASDSPPHEARP